MSDKTNDKDINGKNSKNSNKLSKPSDKSSDTGKKRRRITNKIGQMVEDMSERHSRVCITRIDIRFPEGYQSDGSNKEIIQFHDNLRDFMYRNNIDHEYVTVREQADSSIHHYHTMICTNGSKLSKPKRLQETGNEIWKGIVGSNSNGLVNYPKHQPTHPVSALQMIKRPLREAEGADLERQQNKCDKAKSIAKEHGSYLAKEYSKGKSGKYREVLCSQRKKSKNK